MRRCLNICLMLVAAALLMALPAGAAAKPAGTTGKANASKAKAKKAKQKTPAVTRVAPMRARVGSRLTIRGRNFSSKRSRNTVVFRAPNGRTAFAKPRRASSKQLSIVVPAAVARLLARANGKQTVTRFKLRVLVKKKFSKYTSRRLSPVIVGSSSGGGPGGGAPAIASCNKSDDHDGDLLSNSYELQIKTDPCLRDTDLDGVEDGFEQQSALDLNYYPATAVLPYPGKRPYPNALDSSDKDFDYDGDGLSLGEEYKLWSRFAADGVGFAAGGGPGSLSNLLYSDGLQRSRAVAAPPAGTLANWALDNGDGILRDGERDADGDGLGNWDEQHGRMTEAWWPAQHDGQNEPTESPYPPGFGDFLDNEDTAPAYDAFADWDMDGDGVADGQDDADHDGLTNQFELERPGDWDTDAFTPSGASFVTGPNPWAYTNPFNPCKPYRSERCHEYVPFGYYESDERPPVGPSPPAGYPTTHPITPDG